MRNPTATTQKWVLLSTLFALFTTRAPAQVDLGQVQVSTIGHRFEGLDPWMPKDVTDVLIDQRQSSGGGGVLPSVSANFDINNQFVLTIAAPSGKRFLVQPPAGQPVYLGAGLNWRCGQPPYSPSVFGTVTLIFGDLAGTLPDLSASRSLLTEAHEVFGFNDIQSNGFTNEISFSSIRLTATVPSANSGRGTLDYAPDLDSGFAFYYFTSQTDDPGSFVSIVPVPEPSTTGLLLLGISLAGGLVRAGRQKQ